MDDGGIIECGWEDLLGGRTYCSRHHYHELPWASSFDVNRSWANLYAAHDCCLLIIRMDDTVSQGSALARVLRHSASSKEPCDGGVHSWMAVRGAHARWDPRQGWGAAES